MGVCVHRLIDREVTRASARSKFKLFIEVLEIGGRLARRVVRAGDVHVFSFGTIGPPSSKASRGFFATSYRSDLSIRLTYHRPDIGCCR